MLIFDCVGYNIITFAVGMTIKLFLPEYLQVGNGKCRVGNFTTSYCVNSFCEILLPVFIVP